MEMTLGTFKDYFWKHMNYGRSAQLLLLDLAAVIEMVDNHLMAHRLTNIGIQGSAFTVACKISLQMGREGGA